MFEEDYVERMKLECRRRKMQMLAYLGLVFLCFGLVCFTVVLRAMNLRRKKIAQNKATQEAIEKYEEALKNKAEGEDEVKDEESDEASSVAGSMKGMTGKVDPPTRSHESISDEFNQETVQAMLAPQEDFSDYDSEYSYEYYDEEIPPEEIDLEAEQ